MVDKSVLNIIWRRSTLDYVLEGQFIHSSLLGKLKCPLRRLIFDQDDEFPYMDDVLVVSLFEDTHHLIKNLANHGAKNIGVLQMGDELGLMRQEYLHHADYVLRNYFFPEKFHLSDDMRCKSVEWIPNGHANGVGRLTAINNGLPFQHRLQTLFFSGFIENENNSMADRKDMMRVIQENNLPATLHPTECFGGGYGSATFASYLGNSKFALCPAGNSTETIRFYDAIENGAIPITLDAGYLTHEQALGGFNLGGAPVVVLNNWKELPDFIQKVASQPHGFYEELRQELQNWWQLYKTKKALKIADIIDRSFARKEWSQDEIIPIVSKEYTAEFDGDEVTVSLDSGIELKMNKVGFVILEMCNGSDSISEIASSLSRLFDADIGDIEVDVKKSVRYLANNGVVQFVQQNNKSECKSALTNREFDIPRREPQESEFLRTLIVQPVNGLMNRFRSLASASILAEFTNRKFLVNWTPECSCNVNLQDIVEDGYFENGYSVNRNNCYYHSGPERSSEQQFINEMINAQQEIMYLLAGGNFIPTGMSVSEFNNKKSAFYRNIPFTKRIKNESGEFISKHENYIGMHLRITDRSKWSPNLEYVESIISKSDSKFYICSDDRSVIASLKSKFGNKIVSFNVTDLNRGTPECIIQSTIEWLILANSSQIYYSLGSSFSYEACIYNKLSNSVEMNPNNIDLDDLKINLEF